MRQTCVGFSWSDALSGNQPHNSVKASPTLYCYATKPLVD